MEAGKAYRIIQHPRSVEIPPALWQAILDDLDTIAAGSMDLRVKLVNAQEGNERE